MAERIFTEILRDKETKARLGYIDLPHGRVETPAFMPVGTNGTVKGIYHDKVEEIGYKLILGNTYHLYLRPGLEVLEKFGGLHKFSNWNHNILTDSGGFQVFSLSGLRKVKESGVTFQSHIDGSKHVFTPEKVVDIQSVIGSDIAMVLDVCTPPGIEYRNAKEAWRVTKAWAERSIQERNRLGEKFRGNLFGIVQGNFYKDLRKESAETLSEMDFPGIAIGGLSVGETKDQFLEYLEYTASYITDEKPRYVMGIGSPDYILACVENGIDLFDCVLATRMARNGGIFTDDGVITMKKAVHKFDERPLQEGCTCTCCQKYSRAYLHHLIKCNEMLGGMLATEHNLTYLYNLMERIRLAIREGRFAEFKREYLARFYG
ncbi:MAG: tRNA guanosine(34) transglycosylase Tgt [Spirochaetales bacterium]|nr:tRNA guanosine(34) transglycosylase Tgt [Spirochaetales bacterium]MDD7008086.1 tRNA guanosine(34) transglycosylase Tgt [Spirochaetales bacterium]MDY2815191.1 tRNA guanosine(34) transglycosylase Tgt [Bullifex sp.]MDY5908741.1 tRNA guanosine(34) transglycosylase Tgt [Bullifex sp.]